MKVVGWFLDHLIVIRECLVGTRILDWKCYEYEEKLFSCFRINVFTVVNCDTIQPIQIFMNISTQGLKKLTCWPSVIVTCLEGIYKVVLSAYRVGSKIPIAAIFVIFMHFSFSIMNTNTKHS